MSDEEVVESVVPKLVLPPPIEVRPPKFTYSQYLEEELPLKTLWDKEFDAAKECATRLDEIKTEIAALKRESGATKRNSDLDSSEKKGKVESIADEIEELRTEADEQESARRIHEAKGHSIRRPWRKEQKRRWKDGFAGLTGIHYFYLTQVKIKDAEGNLIRPTWRNVDEIILNEFLECLKNQKDLYIFKRREIGLSSIFGGLIPLWISIMFPGSRTLMTSADLRRAEDLLAEKFIAQHGSLEDWVQALRKNYDKMKGAILAELDDDGVETGMYADITCRQTSQDRKDVTNLEGARAKYAFLDELFLHPYPQDVRRAVESCLMAGMARVGIMVAGGSAGSVSRLGMKEARAIWKASESGNRLKCMLLKGSLGISEATIWDENGNVIGKENFCINGWDDEARAEAYINWQRATLDLNSDKGDLLSFIKRYPLTIDEVFQSDERGVIPDDVAKLIAPQELELVNHPRNIRRVSIITLPNGIVSFENDPKGAWLISQGPVKGMNYEMGTDAIPMLMKKEEITMDPDGTERSMHCSVIKCVETNEYVAIYLMRTSDEKRIYNDVWGGQQLYNNCQNMIERNRGDVLYLQYKNDNNLSALAYQPQWIGSKGFKKNTIRGIVKDGHNTEKIYNVGFKYFREHMSDVDFPIILEQLRVFGMENTDVIDAIFMCEVMTEGRIVTDGRRAINAMKAQYNEVPYMEIKNGKRVVVMRKVMTEKSMKEFYGEGSNWKAAI